MYPQQSDFGRPNLSLISIKGIEIEDIEARVSELERTATLSGGGHR